MLCWDEGSTSQDVSAHLCLQVVYDLFWIIVPCSYPIKYKEINKQHATPQHWSVQLKNMTTRVVPKGYFHYVDILLQNNPGETAPSEPVKTTQEYWTREFQVSSEILRPLILEDRWVNLVNSIRNLKSCGFITPLFIIEYVYASIRRFWQLNACTGKHNTNPKNLLGPLWSKVT